METFSALLALCAGNSSVTGDFPSQKPVTQSFDVFFDLCLNRRFSKRDAGDLRHRRAQYDVTVMCRYVVNKRDNRGVIRHSFNIMPITSNTLAPISLILQRITFQEQHPGTLSSKIPQNTQNTHEFNTRISIVRLAKVDKKRQRFHVWKVSR